MALPQRLPLTQMQSNWASQLDPLLALPPVQGTFLKNVALKSGVNVINHLLGQVQQGWIITDQQGPAQIYRSEPFNNLTLTLTSSQAVTVSLWVY